jgi:hypothetical protein
MQAYRTQARVESSGDLIVHSLPFAPGQEVEVIVLPSEKQQASNGSRNALKGSVLRYDRPTDPADEDAWESA